MTTDSDSSTIGREAATSRGGGLRREVAVLCATEITTWGALFYALPVAASTIADDQGWTLPQILGAFTVAQLVAGALGFWVGRHIDRAGPRRIMTLGSVLGAGALVAVAMSGSLVTLYAAWIVGGAAMSATLYAPAFAAITGWAAGDEHRRLRALTAVTLVAGLASTAFAPLTAWLLGPLGWRGTYLVLAGFVAATAVAHWLGLRAAWPDRDHDEVVGQDSGPDATIDFARADFRLLVAGMTLAGFAVSAVVVNLVPLLTEHGLSVRMAAVVLGVGGVGQVTGRVFYALLSAVTSPATRTWSVLAVVALSTVGLAEIHDPVVIIVVLSFVGGMARGLFTLIQATAVVDRWGTRHYGSRSGILSGATMAAAAIAPWAGASIAVALDGYSTAFWLFAAGAMLGAALATASQPSGRRVRSTAAR
ncbi:MFS transporter [Nocardioides bigeumensis]|uniref:MFS transporter n=1 Tax=Nocardioides bigeumensis TaxID=433657 RepID=A0ABN2XP59_9ACTN